jgi:hypothetical protein
MTGIKANYYTVGVDGKAKFGNCSSIQNAKVKGMLHWSQIAGMLSSLMLHWSQTAGMLSSLYCFFLSCEIIQKAKYFQITYDKCH